MAEILSERRRVTFALPETAARDAADGELAAAIENLGIELDAAASAAFDDREAAPFGRSCRGILRYLNVLSLVNRVPEHIWGLSGERNRARGRKCHPP